MLEPNWVTLPVPVMVLAKVKASVRLKAKLPLLVTSKVPKVPVDVALPNCKVPAEMVTPPGKVLAPVKAKVPLPNLFKPPLVKAFAKTTVWPLVSTL